MVIQIAVPNLPSPLPIEIEEGEYDRIVCCSFCRTERRVLASAVRVGTEGECLTPGCHHNVGWFSVVVS